MVQSSKVPFTSEVLQEIISPLFMKEIENFIMGLMKYLQSIKQSAQLAMSCQYKECSCDLSFHYVALIKKMRKHPYQLPLYEGIKVINHITRVTVADNPVAIPMSSVKMKCMRVEFDAALVYVCHLPNSFEKD